MQDGGLSYWAEKGAPLHKLLLGTPFYGRSFTLANNGQNKPGAKITGKMSMGSVSRSNFRIELNLLLLTWYRLCTNRPEYIFNNASLHL